MERLVGFLKKNYKAVIAAVVCVCCILFVIASLLPFDRDESKTENESVSENVSVEEVGEAYESGGEISAGDNPVSESAGNADSDKKADGKKETDKIDINENNINGATESLPPEENKIEKEENKKEENKEEEKSPHTESGAVNDKTDTDNKKSICTFSISCASIKNSFDKLDKSKAAFVPADGWILKPTQVSFEEGESVFDVLKCVTRDNNIQMEFSETPAYNSAYIEGINNIYEFDCGELSGWKYSVNGSFPSVGCSLYSLKDGDKVEWKYTCDLGRDIENEVTGYE